MPKLYKILALFALFHLTHSHRPGSHRHNYGSSRFNQMADQSASNEIKPEINSTTSTISNGDNYIKFTEFLHLNFSHSKQFSGLPQTNPTNDPSSFDPFAALRQLLPAMPSPPNWNSWSQFQANNGRIGIGGNDPRQPRHPNIVPSNNIPFGPGAGNNVNKQRNGGFNNNYNYNFGGKNMERFGINLSPHGNSAATTGFPGRRGFKESTTEKSPLSREDERLPTYAQKQPRSNSKFNEKSGERPSLSQRNITAYWIF